MTIPLRLLLAAGASLLLVGCGGASGIRVKDTTRTFTTVVVDAGHGGKDNGANRRYGGAEKHATLDVAQRLAQKLRESQFNVVMTRSSDEFVALDRRAAISNRQNNAIFVSVHFNDSGRRGIRGFETYYHSPVARPLAHRIQQQIMTLPGAVNRGVKTANFRVLRRAKYPAVLVECGFLSNRKEGAAARSAARRDGLADKIAEAIVDQRYGKGTYRAPAEEADASASSSEHGN
ncbi:MAG TPA: N-acetylmuramoyl-L-alanine amidase [Chthoniobacterales bacterium]|jgi:N-acetylmuramoyl-L-alanine amidase|nr:N-acetylmuramoyl-L-alanine amidase [Chthoniobacterales bacterium]